MGAWAAEYGQTYPPTHVQLSDGRGLATWGNNIRRRYHQGALTTEQIADCESIPHWSWRRRPRRRIDAGRKRMPFDERVRRLADFVQATGDLPVAGDFDDDGYGVANFAEYLRAAYAAGTLTAEQVTIVERLVPGWRWQPRRPGHRRRSAPEPAAADVDGPGASGMVEGLRGSGRGPAKAAKGPAARAEEPDRRADGES